MVVSNSPSNILDTFRKETQFLITSLKSEIQIPNLCKINRSSKYLFIDISPQTLNTDQPIEKEKNSFLFSIKQRHPESVWWGMISFEKNLHIVSAFQMKYLFHNLFPREKILLLSKNSSKSNPNPGMFFNQYDDAWSFPGGSVVKNLPAKQETQV